MKQYITNSDKETRLLAGEIAQGFKKGVIALYGELGAGKTTFVQGFAKSLGIKDKILSPTFVLIRQHSLANNQTFYHIDLYRLEKTKDLKSIGMDEILSNLENITLIEWADRLSHLPKQTVKIEIEKLSAEKRLIKVS